LDLGAIVVVAMDGQSLAKSKKMLLQAMSEEKPTGFKTEHVSEQMQKIVSIGKDPWMVRNLEGKIWCKRPDAKKLSVTPLRLDGTPLEPHGNADVIQLRQDTIYYLIESTE
jgi:hypothetical protein